MKDKPSTKINFYVPLKDKPKLLDKICEMMAYYDLSMSKIIRIAVKEKHDEFCLEMLPHYLTKMKAKKIPDPVMEMEIMHEEGNLLIMEEEVITNARL